MISLDFMLVLRNSCAVMYLFVAESCVEMAECELFVSEQERLSTLPAGTAEYSSTRNRRVLAVHSAEHPGPGCGIWSAMRGRGEFAAEEYRRVNRHNLRCEALLQDELRLGQVVDYGTVRKRYSFMVRLVFDGVLRCGGAVIADR